MSTSTAPALMFVLFLSIAGIFAQESGDADPNMAVANYTLEFQYYEESVYYENVTEVSEDDAMAAHSPAAWGRGGGATNTHSCSSIRAVPAHLRSRSHMAPHGLGYFYQKYTEAYGIPVLGSQGLSNSALQRACYTVRFLLADRADIRASYYRMYGRFAIMARNEVTTHIPEHTSLGAWWNTRARGLGATRDRPVSTAGEENALCYQSDGYREEDILLHEFSHGVHLLGASYAIPGFDRRVKAQYNYARSRGMWRSTYAMSTDHEYLAEGVQSYFGVNVCRSYADGIHGSVCTRSKLYSYDPTLYGFVQELFPCGNTYIDRCTNDRAAELRQSLKMNWDGKRCYTLDGGGGGGDEDDDDDEDEVGGCTDDNARCAEWAGRGECLKNPAYMHVNCKKSCAICDDEVVTPTPGSCTDDDTQCAAWASRGECSKNSAEWMAENCRKSCDMCDTGDGDEDDEDDDDEEEEEIVSPPPPVDCTDDDTQCAAWASRGECSKNPEWMHENCRKSCDTCDTGDGDDDDDDEEEEEIVSPPPPGRNTTEDDNEDEDIVSPPTPGRNTTEDDNEDEDIVSPPPPGRNTTEDDNEDEDIVSPPPPVCEDDNPLCGSWARRGECSNNPDWMHDNCRKSCNKCGADPQPDCADLNGRCAEWAGRGECTRNPAYMLPFCPKSCDKC